ncbi:MAG TPA: hypothetical protein VIL14_00385 [Nitrososphaeraceae archaeon]
MQDIHHISESGENNLVKQNYEVPPNSDSSTIRKRTVQELQKQYD